MPWNDKLLNSNLDYQSQKQCKTSSFAFYQAVRDLLPVWLLEDMRTTEVFHWEEGGKVSSYSPSEALLYALVHDHQPYAYYLLNKYSKKALDMPSKSFCCCQSSAPHLAMAVRYNRINSLERILKTVKELAENDRSLYVNSRGCIHTEGGQTPLHLACELGRLECLTLLLGYGASPSSTDCNGQTPLDTLLQQICQNSSHLCSIRLCLDKLLLFMPDLQFKMRSELLNNSGLWQNLLGENTFQWLVGFCPPTLYVMSMQVLIKAISPEQFPEGLANLPVPHFLKPLNVSVNM
ncbi:ankyrin repeat domain-containing protein 9 [Protopterus annectens]|uniref:ankyrin repeat domain-containing protein 9 n=1 Tax=Protopterus annectens TaxID=7888 RepID=UPI001CFA1AC5|nr:ankyrin repeat domain-containing protein 9 [Protopterus annectens]